MLGVKCKVTPLCGAFVCFQHNAWIALSLRATFASFLHFSIHPENSLGSKGDESTPLIRAPLLVNSKGGPEHVEKFSWCYMI